MKVKDLIKQLEVLNPNAEVMILSEMDDDRGYQTIFDCEEEYSDLVTIGCGYPVVTKKILKKAIKENNTEILADFEADDIGQGYGYKSHKDWDKVSPDEVIYIPECGYNTEYGDGCGYPINADYAYTKKDFIKIVKNRVHPDRIDDEAFALFDMVDWQPPEVLADELNYDKKYKGE